MGINYDAHLAIGYAFSMEEVFKTVLSQEDYRKVTWNGDENTTAEQGPVRVNGKDIETYEVANEVAQMAGLSYDEMSSYEQELSYEIVDDRQFIYVVFGYHDEKLPKEEYPDLPDIMTSASFGRADVGNGISLSKLGNIGPYMDRVAERLMKVGLNPHDKAPGVHVIMHVG